jgi:hypothetical protein
MWCHQVKVLEDFCFLDMCDKNSIVSTRHVKWCHHVMKVLEEFGFDDLFHRHINTHAHPHAIVTGEPDDKW